MPDQQFTKCPLCGFQPTEIRPLGSRTVSRFICKRCGVFDMTDTLYAGIEQNEMIQIKGHLLSGLCRERFESKEGNPPEFTTVNLEKFLNKPTIPESDNVELKSRKLLMWVKKQTKYYGETIGVNDDIDYPLAYAKNDEEFGAIIRLLEDSNLISKPGVGYIGAHELQLTNLGWNLFKRNNEKSKQAFVAIWFDPSMDAATDAICNAIKNTGYDPMCIKNEHFSERIMDKAISEIRKSKFVIADLTGGRRSVYFEVGLANGLGIDTIFVYEKSAVGTDTSLDFYVKHFQCYGYDNESELKEILRDAIGARIK